MADGNQIRITDGSTSFEGGVDSGQVPTVASQEYPTGLKKNQLSWLTNASVRGGGITTRTGWNRIAYDFTGDTGLFQGAAIYTPDADVPYIVMSISGHIYRCRVWADGAVDDISIPGDPNPAAEEQSFFVQGEQFMVIQAGDYVTNPLFWDGVTMWRSTGYGVYPGVSQVPPGRCMEYYMGRIWVQIGARNYAAGDIVYGPSGTAGYNYRDSILYWTENTYLAGGGAFNVPNQFGAIRAIKHPAAIDSALGEGQLIIFSRDAIYALQVPVDRNEWQAVDADNQPLQKVIQLRYGTTAERSVVRINGDLFYSAYDGARSLQMAVRNYPDWGQRSISRNINRAWQFNDRTYARFASGVEFDNRFLLTIMPSQTDVGVIHKGVVVLDFDVITSLQSKLPPAWEGMYEGLQFLQLLEAESGGLQRCFGIIRSTDTGKIEVWELTNYQKNEEGDKRVNWVVETPAYTWGKPFMLKELDTAELWIDKIYGTVDFQVQYRVDQDPCWVDWHLFRLCNARDSCEDIDAVCYPGSTVTYREGYRATVTMPKPPKRGDANMIRPTTQGYQFQMRILVKGWCRIRGILLHAFPRFKAPYDGLVS